MSQSPEPTTTKVSSALEETLDNDNDGDDDDIRSEPDDPVYDESQESFPAYPAFDPAIEAIRIRAELLVTRLDNSLGPFAAVNKDLGNMKTKSAEVMKPKPSKRIRFGLLCGTGAGKVI